MRNLAVEKAIKIVGSQMALAKQCGKAQSTICDWLHGKKKVSAENAKRIENATNGNVPAYQIRPDLTDLFPHP